MSTTDYFATLPEALQERARDRWNDIDADSNLSRVLLTDTSGPTLSVLLATSEFASQWIAHNQSELQQLVESGALENACKPSELFANIADAANGCEDETDLMAVMRQQRQRNWVRLLWRDIAGLAPLTETIRALSSCADAALTVGMEKLARFHEVDQNGLFVLALGKLGGHELNFSSDVDIIFGCAGETEPDRALIRLSQRLGQLLEQPTADGFAFRVDTRLRPHGKVGPPVISSGAMENYYQNHGRDWERYALIKARTCAGDITAGDSTLNTLRPFVYRKYLDFGAFEAIRDMHSMIEAELEMKGLDRDVKRGRGGIRQIEFMVQSEQLIRGGRARSLQTASLHGAISALVDLGELRADDAATLIEDYAFLRNVEHRLQMQRDEQTHQLPETDDENAWTVLACAMGEPTADTLRARLEQVRDRVDRRFAERFRLNAGSNTSRSALWPGLDSPEATPDDDLPDEFHRLLNAFRTGAMLQSLSAEGRTRIDRLMPALLEETAQTASPVNTLSRIIHLLESIGRRPTYFSALIEFPAARDQVVQLCAASPWLAEQLADHPILLDELISPVGSGRPTRAELEAEAMRLMGDDRHDVDVSMERLREFRHAGAFRVAARQLKHDVTPGETALDLTYIAEITLERVFDAAVAALRDRLPASMTAGPQLAVIAYGKLGSHELGFMSDVDIIFLYDDQGTYDHEQQGAYARIAQRMISMLTTRLASGLLYEVDVRLRPSGRKGLLVSSIDAFRKYQENDAWTFEHQAMVRARPVAGDAGVADAFLKIRQEILSQTRDAESLKKEVDDMRNRMMSANDISEGDSLDLKNGRGALIDIEFIAQYAVLAQGATHPALLEVRRTIDVIEEASKAGVVDPQECLALAQAYEFYLGRIDQTRMREEKSLDGTPETLDHARRVRGVWSRLFAVPQAQ